MQKKWYIHALARRPSAPRLFKLLEPLALYYLLVFVQDMLPEYHATQEQW